MIGPIMPTGTGPTQPFGAIGQSSLGANLLSNLGSTQGLAASGGTRSAEGSSALLRLQETLTGMVDQLGLDARSKELLHLLIGLIILMALLNSTQNGAGGLAGQGSGELPSSASGATPFISLVSTTTTISIEQTSTVITMGTTGNLSDTFNPSTTDSFGGRVDLTA